MCHPAFYTQHYSINIFRALEKLIINIILMVLEILIARMLMVYLTKLRVGHVSEIITF